MHLVFGKAVRSRYYRITVNAERSPLCSEATEREVLGRLPDMALVLGGVRNGDSRYAPQRGAQAKRVTLLAAAERREDGELQRKYRYGSSILSTTRS